MATVVLVKVFVRPRPFTKDETELNRPYSVTSSTSNEIILKLGTTEKKYTFDRVFQPGCTQAEVYDIVVSPLIDFVMSGYTCTVFAYGQTGTGKTHTMIGEVVAPNIDFANDPTVGIIPRAAIHLFEELTRLKIAYSVRVSFVEIYNEEIRDLLVSEGVPLRVYDDPDNKGATCIKGLTDTFVESTKEIYDLLNIGAAERQTASTKLNRLSSRSHTIFSIVVNTSEIINGEEVIRTGKLNLIDLAGSENIGRSGATEMRAREAGSINKSLLTLGKVIKALALKMQHVPYRESKLTRILQDSLGGKSQTCMIATFAPCVDCFDETISTLDYAHVARSVTNCPTMNINKTSALMFKAPHEEIKKLREELEAVRSGEGFYLPTESYEHITNVNKTRDERILVLMREIQDLEQHVIAKQREEDKMRKSFEACRSKLENVTKKVTENEKIINLNSYVVHYTNGHLAQLNDTASKLQDITTISTNNEDVFYNKYETQCDSTMNNATILEKITALSVNSQKSFNKASDKLCNHNVNITEDCLTRLATLHQNQESDVQKIKVLQSNLVQSTPNLTLDGLFKDGVHSKSKFQSELKSIGDDCANLIINYRKEMEKTFKEIQEFSLRKRNELETLATDCNNEIREELAKDKDNVIIRDEFLRDLYKCLEDRLVLNKKRLYHVRRINHMRAQMKIELDARRKILTEEMDNIQVMQETINELISRSKKDALEPLLRVRSTISKFKEEVKPLINDVLSQAQTKVNSVKENRNKCLKEVDSCEAQSMEFCRNFIGTYEAELKHHHEERQTNLHNCADRLTEIHQRLLSDLGHVEHVATNIEKMGLANESYEDETVQFIKQMYEKFLKLQESPNTEIHVGDTPVKPDYQYPKVIESKAENLTARFERMDD